jgi:cytochrome bd-type quinol oxidase subunit 2
VKYDLLVYLALAAFLIVIGVAGYVLAKTPDTGNLDTRKIRFAAATFTGILMLFVFTAILYFVDPQGPGKEIFDKAVTAMTPLAGAIIGYIFASRQGSEGGA